MTQKKTKRTYQLKIALRYSKPPIWRRITIPSNWCLAELHDVIQVVMGWEFSHLHIFTKNNVEYGDLMEMECWDGSLKDEIHTKLHDVLINEKDKLYYEYDFGDGWEHIITLEKILPFNSKKHKLPVCLRGLRACPPEDCGGIGGYEYLKEVLSNPEHPEYSDIAEWLDIEHRPFDPDFFDIDKVNEILQNPIID